MPMQGLHYRVVICLKNRTFAVSQTTKAHEKYRETLLWFAWKIVLLQYRKQRRFALSSRINGCDLLEKSYFCSIANNKTKRACWRCRVVICLKNRTFAVSQTTGNCKTLLTALLWFAWKIVLLQYRKQPPIACGKSLLGCDLLEKSYFCSIANNDNCRIGVCQVVVICLKNRTFAVSQTT